MKAIPATNLKFTAESAETTDLSDLEFILGMKVTGGASRDAFDQIETIYKALTETVDDLTLDGATLAVTDPSGDCHQERAFSIGTEYGLERKMMVSLNLLVTVNFKKPTNFWMRGATLATIIDALEGFCEAHSVEKKVSVFLTRAAVPRD